MSPDAAQQLMEQSRERLEAAGVRLQEADEPPPW